MNAKLLLNMNDKHATVSFSPRMKMWGLVFAAFTALMLAGCNYPLSANTPSATPTEPSTPLNTASISGYVWHDLCANLEKDEPLPAGCIDDRVLDVYVANGVFEAGETGLANVTVELGFGLCSADSVLSTTTDAAGRYTFQGLAPGTYCVRAVVQDGSGQPAKTETGVWTFPLGVDENTRGMQSLTLQVDDQRENVNFGYDPFNVPEDTNPAATPSPTPSPSSDCSDAATFVKDVSVPDGTYIDAGKSFSKVWRLRNSGTCTWTSEYALTFQSGYRMGAASVIPMHGSVEPGDTVDLTIDLRAPQTPGSFWGFWMLRNANGQLFGTGDDGNSPVWVKIITEPEIREWRGVYFDNQNLSGNPVLVRNDKSIDFNWKAASPASSLPDDHFSARWTRTLKFDEAFYRFTIRVDDGVRLWVDDRLVIDSWAPNPLHSVNVVLRMAEGKHDLKLEYFERSGEARIHFDTEIIHPDNQNYWVGKYWYNRSLDSSWALVKQADELDFDWGKNSPALGLPKDDFSARWSRIIEFTAGNYRLCARADDGVRVKVDGKLVLNEWHANDASQDYCVDLSLSGSTRLDVEYYERSGAAEVEFWWKLLDPPIQMPVANPDAYETPRNETLSVPAPGILSNDKSGLNWDPSQLTAMLVDNVSHGVLSFKTDGSFTYTPETDFSGEDAFTYRISDGENTSNTARVSISVVDTNSPPIATDDSYEILEDETLQVDAPGILANDYDPDGQTLRITLEEEPQSGELVMNEDGSFEYTPAADFHGADRFSYRISDGWLQSGLAFVEIEVLPVNDVPIAVEDRLNAAVNQIVEITVLGNDQGLGDAPLSLTIEELPTTGTIEIQDGLIIYTPEEGYTGEVIITYAVTDGNGERSQARVFLTIGTAGE